MMPVVVSDDEDERKIHDGRVRVLEVPDLKLNAPIPLQGSIEATMIVIGKAVLRA